MLVFGVGLVALGLVECREKENDGNTLNGR